MLTDKYLNGIPKDSRIKTSGIFLNKSSITAEKLKKIKQLNDIAQQRSQKLAHMALAWLLKDKRITSVLIGASKPEQIVDSLQSLKNYHFTDEELHNIENALQK